MRSRSQTVCELKGGSESAGRKEGICGKQKEDLKSEQVEVKQKKNKTLQTNCQDGNGEDWVGGGYCD